MQGDIDADSIDAPALIAAAIGMPPGAAGKDGAWAWPDAAVRRRLFRRFRRRSGAQSAQLAVLPRLTAREFRGTLRLGKNELSFDDITGVVSGGRLTGSLSFPLRRRRPDVTRGKFALAGADAAALLPAAARPPVTGTLDLSLMSKARA